MDLEYTINKKLKNKVKCYEFVKYDCIQQIYIEVRNDYTRTRAHTFILHNTHTHKRNFTYMFFYFFK